MKHWLGWLFALGVSFGFVGSSFAQDDKDRGKKDEKKGEDKKSDSADKDRKDKDEADKGAKKDGDGHDEKSDKDREGCKGFSREDIFKKVFRKGEDKDGLKRTVDDHFGRFHKKSGRCHCVCEKPRDRKDGDDRPEGDRKDRKEGDRDREPKDGDDGKGRRKGDGGPAPRDGKRGDDKDVKRDDRGSGH